MNWMTGWERERERESERESMCSEHSLHIWRLSEMKSSGPVLVPEVSSGPLVKKHEATERLTAASAPMERSPPTTGHLSRTHTHTHTHTHRATILGSEVWFLRSGFWVLGSAALGPSELFSCWSWSRHTFSFQDICEVIATKNYIIHPSSIPLHPHQGRGSWQGEGGGHPGQAASPSQGNIILYNFQYNFHTHYYKEVSNPGGTSPYWSVELSVKSTPW